MQKKSNPGVVIAIIMLIILLGGLIVWFSLGPNWIWYERYQYDDNEPYDARMIYELVKEGVGEKSFELVTDTVYRQVDLEKVPANSNLFFIGTHLYLDSLDTQFFLDFVARGNSAFIICESQPKRLIDSLLNMDLYMYKGDYYNYYDDYEDYDEYIDHYGYNYYHTSVYFDSTVTISLNNSRFSPLDPYPCTYVNDFDPVGRQWSYFKDKLITADNQYVEELGHFNREYLNYIRVPYKSGNFFIHTTPLAFSNFQLKNDTAMNYVRECLAYMGNGKTYFDEKDTHYDPYVWEDDSMLPPEKGPLVFILSEPSLRAAWYVLLGATVLYLMFGLKRKQRVIPVNENMDNTSIEYAEVVSQMFMKQSDHKKLVLLKMEVFRAFLRERFALRLPLKQSEEDDKFYKHVAEKSFVPFDLVKSIFEEYKYLSAIANVETTVMLAFYQKLEQFYAQCK